MKLNEMAGTTARERAHKNLDRFITSMVAISKQSIQDYQQDEGEVMTRENIQDMVWDYVAEAMTDPEQARGFDEALVAAIFAELSTPRSRPQKKVPQGDEFGRALRVRTGRK